MLERLYTGHWKGTSDQRRLYGPNVEEGYMAQVIEKLAKNAFTFKEQQEEWLGNTEVELKLHGAVLMGIDEMDYGYVKRRVKTVSVIERENTMDREPGLGRTRYETEKELLEGMTMRVEDIRFSQDPRFGEKRYDTAHLIVTVEDRAKPGAPASEEVSFCIDPRGSYQAGPGRSREDLQAILLKAAGRGGDHAAVDTAHALQSVRFAEPAKPGTKGATE